MFKLVKWAFRLGQQTERQRIAGILQDSRRFTPYREGLSRDNNQEERAKQAERVDRIINDIIDGITNPTQYEESRYSLLYPKGDDNV